jgi:hypothetical protein
MAPARLPEERHRANAILHVSWMSEQFEGATIGIDHDVALAPDALIVRIVAARSSRLCSPHALAVDHSCRWAWRASKAGTTILDQMEVQALEDASVA